VAISRRVPLRTIITQEKTHGNTIITHTMSRRRILFR